MNPTGPDLGSTAAYGNLYLSCALMRHVLVLLLWSLITGLVIAGASCCCGYAAYAAWTRNGPPSRRQPWIWRRPGEAEDADGAVDLTVAEEAARGIVAIEHYLTSQDRHP
jgi:hypothetical protein